MNKIKIEAIAFDGEFKDVADDTLNQVLKVLTSQPLTLTPKAEELKEKPEPKEKKAESKKKRVANKLRIKREKLKLPGKTQLIEHIKTQPNMEHSVDNIAQHFLGKTISYKGTTKGDYVSLWTAIKRARNEIAKIEHGKWIESKVGEGRFRKKSYKFEKEAPIIPAEQPAASPEQLSI